jgi:hypothetical protein
LEGKTPRLINAPSWQIETAFGFADDATREILRKRATRGHRALGNAGQQDNVSTIMVDTNVYDVASPTLRILRQYDGTGANGQWPRYAGSSGASTRRRETDYKRPHPFLAIELLNKVEVMTPKVDIGKQASKDGEILPIQNRNRFRDRNHAFSYLVACHNAAKLLNDPATLDAARLHLEMFTRDDPSQRHSYALWSVLLDQSAAEIAERMTQNTPDGDFVRETAPSFGVIPSQTRADLIREAHSLVDTCKDVDAARGE